MRFSDLARLSALSLLALPVHPQSTIESDDFNPMYLLAPGDSLGNALAWVGDVTGDGFDEFAIAANTTGGTRGEVFVMSIDHTFANQLLSPFSVRTVTGDPGDQLGSALACLGDLNQDCSLELAVGTATDTVQIWDLSASPGQHLMSTLHGTGGYGLALAGMTEMRADGRRYLAVGAPFTAGGGRVYLEGLDAGGLSTETIAIDAPSGSSRFGSSVSCIGDVDDNGTVDLVVGDPERDSGRGTAWILRLDLDAVDPVLSMQQIPSAASLFTPTLNPGDNFGAAVLGTYDVTGLGIEFEFDTLDPTGTTPDLVVGIPGNDETGANDSGGYWILRLNEDLEVESSTFVPGTFLVGNPPANWRIGESLAFARGLAGRDDYVLAAGAPSGGENDPGVGAVVMDDDIYGTDGLGASATDSASSSNPAVYSAPPLILGRPWCPTADLSVTGHSSALLIATAGFALPNPIVFGGGQELFLDLTQGELFSVQGVVTGSVAVFPYQPENNPLLLGQTVTTQVFLFGTVAPFALSNAFEHFVGAW